MKAKPSCRKRRSAKAEVRRARPMVDERSGVSARSAVTSISIFISGLLSAQTIIVAAGRISPKVSPRIGNTRSTKSASVT